MKKQTYLLLSLPIIFAAIIIIGIIILREPEPNQTTGTIIDAPDTAPIILQESVSSNGDNSSASEKYPDALLPDLHIESPAYAYIGTSFDTVRKLRFPGTFSNIGDGPLELTATHNKNGTLDATQVIYKKDGDKIENLAGTFILHPTHNHWHFENFVTFSLLSLENDGSLGDEISSTGKITYCIHDYEPLSEDFLGKPESVVYPWCTSSLSVQGISVGWADTYEADVDGQELDITGVPDGTYILKTLVDPENLLIEKDETNNSNMIRLEIERNNVRILNSLNL